MKTHVTVVPSDHVIIVDGSVIQISFTAPSNIHAIQWHEGQGHIEFIGHREPNQEFGEEGYAKYVEPFVVVWELEKARLAEEASLGLGGE